MADDGLLVTTSGGALSLLFYENVRAVGDQMGLLLGEVVKYVTRNVTDADRHIESTKTHIDIQGILPCPPTDLIHDNNGKILPKKLKDFVKSYEKKIVGWYRFRPNTSLCPTMRDKILHKELSKFFQTFNDISENVFLACMLNYSVTKQGGTHKFRHVFLRNNYGNYQPIPLKINNLGADASRHDGSDYKPTPIRRPNYEKDYFTTFLDSLNLDLSQSPGIESIIKIQKAAERHLNDLVPRICKSDQELALLEAEVIRKRDHLNTLKCESMNNERNPAGEPHYQSKRKNENQQSNRRHSSKWTGADDTKASNENHFNIGSSNSGNINNICRSPETILKSPHQSFSYSQAIKNTSDSSD